MGTNYHRSNDSFFTGAVSAGIGASGIPFANTAAIMGGSLTTFSGKAVAGAKGLLTCSKAAPGDWAFVGRHLMLGTKYLFSNPAIAWRSYSIGLGLGIMALPKTLYYPIRLLY